MRSTTFIKLIIGISIFSCLSFAVFYTEKGTHLFFKILQCVIPGELIVSEVKGTVATDLHLSEVNYKWQTVSVSIHQLDLNWSPSALLNRKFKINHLLAKQIIINADSIQGSNTHSHSSYAYLSWLRWIDISHLDIEQLMVNQQKQSIAQIDHLSIQKNMNDWKMITVGKLRQFPIHSISYLTYDKRSIEIKHAAINIGHANFHLMGQINANPQLTWKIDIPYLNELIPAMQGSVEGSGVFAGKTGSAHLVLTNIILVNHSVIRIPQADLIGKINLEDSHDFLAECWMNKGKIFSETLNVTMDVNHLYARYRPTQPIFFNASLLSMGEGSVDGQIDLNKTGYPLQVRIQGENLRLVDLPEYKVNVSPQININYLSQDLSVEGKINIPWARIKPKDLSNTVTLPHEVIFEDDNKAKNETPINITTHLNIELGKEVYLRYQYLRAQLGGKILISQTPTMLPTAVGELYTIKGNYHAYDQKLTIDNGRLIYTGNELSNPGLDIKALKEIKTKNFTDGQTTFSNADAQIKHAYAGSEIIKVGVWVKGTLEKPVISLYSNPPGFAQTDILSYLIFGYPQTHITQASTLSLLNALAMSIQNNHEGELSQLLLKVKKIKKKLGISEFGISSAEVYDPSKQTMETKTTFSVGKKVSEKLYLRYSVGIFSPIQILNLTLQLTTRLAIQSETSGIETGADIMYEVEKD